MGFGIVGFLASFGDYGVEGFGMQGLGFRVLDPGFMVGGKWILSY